MYADFTPTYIYRYTHYDVVTVYREKLQPDPLLEMGSVLLTFVATEGEVGVVEFIAEPALHGMGLSMTTGIEVFEETTVRKQWNLQSHPQQVVWSMSDTYYRKNESWKISNETCKPKWKVLDQNGINALTQTLTAYLPGLIDKIPGTDLQEDVSRRVVGVEH